MTAPSRIPTALLALLVVILASACVGTALAESPIKSDEEVILFPSPARFQNGRWVAPIHGWIYERETTSVWRRPVLSSLRRTLKVAKSQVALFKKRAAWFLVDCEGGKEITVRAGSSTSRMPDSRGDGHFYGIMKLPAGTAGSSVDIEAVTRESDSRRFRGKVFLIPDTGTSVISDIDDTIKITDATDRQRTLERTFLEPFLPVPGMAERYRKWQGEGAVFHYVSASPWHLYQPLAEFLVAEGFPEGTVHLRKFRVKESSRWNLLRSPTAFKKKNIEKLLRSYPGRRFILVGDSGQVDPEIYADITRRYPKQIEAIYIREVQANKMTPDRLEQVKAGLGAPLHIL